MSSKKKNKGHIVLPPPLRYKRKLRAALVRQFKETVRANTNADIIRGELNAWMHDNNVPSSSNIHVEFYGDVIALVFIKNNKSTTLSELEGICDVQESKTCYSGTCDLMGYPECECGDDY